MTFAHNVAGSEALSRTVGGRDAASSSYYSSSGSSTYEGRSVSCGSSFNCRAACIAAAIVGIVASILMIVFGVIAAIPPLTICGIILSKASIVGLGLAIAGPGCE
jgi:hypothetical protein